MNARTGISNGRAARIREYLAQVKSARSPREILNAVEPGGSMTNFCSTLAYMAQRGQVVRTGHGKGKARFRMGDMTAVVTREMIRKQAGAGPSAKAATAVRRSTTHFTAAPGSIDNSHCPHRRASAQISADIEAFKRRGGRIEKLGTTVIFHLDDDAANDDADDQ